MLIPVEDVRKTIHAFEYNVATAEQFREILPPFRYRLNVRSTANPLDDTFGYVHLQFALLHVLLRRAHQPVQTGFIDGLFVEMT
jgi:hypothetical protein